MEQTELTIRLVEAGDCRLLWEWVNEPETRRQSFSPRPIPWEEHCQWFEARLTDPYCYIYIVMNSRKEPLAQIRFEVRDGEGVVSVSVAKASRGQGVGTGALRLAMKQCAADSSLKRFHAYIRPDNIASLRAFDRIGFRFVANEEIRGQAAVHTIMEIES